MATLELCIDADFLRQSFASVLGAIQTIFPRAGIGIASVDHHGTNSISRSAGLTQTQMLSANLNRCRTKAVFCEDASDRSTFVKQDNGEVFAIGLSHTRFSDTDAHACNGFQLTGNRRVQVNWHGSALFCKYIYVDTFQLSKKNEPEPVFSMSFIGSTDKCAAVTPIYRDSACIFCHCRKGTARCVQHVEQHLMLEQLNHPALFVLHPFLWERCK